jgi:hypothetical protein
LAIPALLDANGGECHIIVMTDRAPTNLPLEDWIADLEISEAQHDRGETVPMAPVMQRLRDSIEQLEARRREKTPRTATRQH